MPDQLAEGDGVQGDRQLATPRFDESDALEVLEILADYAVVVAHYLLDYAGKDSPAEGAARSLLNVLRIEVAGVLKDHMPLMCTQCGTSGDRFMLATSRRHQRCDPANVIGATSQSAVHERPDDAADRSVRPEVAL